MSLLVELYLELCQQNDSITGYTIPIHSTVYKGYKFSVKFACRRSNIFYFSVSKDCFLSKFLAESLTSVIKSNCKIIWISLSVLSVFYRAHARSYKGGFVWMWIKDVWPVKPQGWENGWRSHDELPSAGTYKNCSVTDPGSGAFLTPRSGIQDGKKSGSGILNEHHKLFFRKLRNRFLG